MDDIETVQRSQADAAWKEILDQFLEEAIALCFPKLHACIDWKRHWDPLDKEFQTIAPSSVKGKHFVDKLVRVYLPEGEEAWLLIHIEVQGDQDSSFPDRMFIYHYRIYDKFGRHPISCAILTDDSKKWRPEHYRYNQLDCKLLFEYPIFKLLDMEAQREQLEASCDPFAIVILVQLDALRSKKKRPNERCQIKIKLTKRLYEKGFSNDTIIALYEFIDGLIRLPEPIAIEYKQEVLKLEEKKHMRYISSIERMGIEQGIEIGTEITTKEIALRMLQKGQPIDVVSELVGLDQSAIIALAGKTEAISV